ncbi:MAG: LysO family transporter [Clostridium argentinense]|uniref:LysO family transporter n=1 Tax=Clostridium faecium TaxID=2762223 RepID=A0ABR8YN95_9CLOT|nr:MULTISPECIES: LysO family transporter [Clostridium]MBD8045718.1 LysO family transporter [Clostridium faecium]MBS5823977.1 LysO family transporter [Clostridium argentinense]MDU1348863.1 LysO family transporter [Clostridium argentinense]
MKILIALILGIILGYFTSLTDKQKEVNGKLQQLGVVFLLFFMGASIGANEEVIKNIGRIGLKSFTFSLMACIFSVIVVYFVSKKIFCDKKDALQQVEKEVVSEQCE